MDDFTDFKTSKFTDLEIVVVDALHYILNQSRMQCLHFLKTNLIILNSPFHQKLRAKGVNLKTSTEIYPSGGFPRQQLVGLQLFRFLVMKTSRQQMICFMSVCIKHLEMLLVVF